MLGTVQALQALLGKLLWIAGTGLFRRPVAIPHTECQCTGGNCKKLDLYPFFSTN